MIAWWTRPCGRSRPTHPVSREDRRSPRRYACGPRAEYGLSGGHPMHGEHASTSSSPRPLLGHARYRLAEIRGLYLCGAGAHPGAESPAAPGKRGRAISPTRGAHDVAARDVAYETRLRNGHCDLPCVGAWGCRRPLKRPRKDHRYPRQVPQRSDITSVAIVAHVDHGKTTLVDALLSSRGHSARIRMSPGRSSTPGSSNARRGSRSSPRTPPSATVRSRSTSSTRQAMPTSAEKVERGLTMVDGVLLLVDADEGPCHRRVLCSVKALERGFPSSSSSAESTARRTNRRRRERGLRALPRPRRGRKPDRVSDRLLQRQGRSCLAQEPDRTLLGRTRASARS